MLAAGTTLGPYKILGLLGAGGMGEVYRAHDSRLGRDVAIKVLSQHLAATPELRARFEREARTISQLNHPHVCVLHDIGHQDGTDYLVMELLKGETLAHRLEKGALPVAEVLSLGGQIADALDRAHGAGIVHRDLKPGNIMLTRSGAKLMDFGLARAHGMAPATGAMSQSPTMSQPLTVEGTIVGTYQYMAPEQLEGKEADARSDIWALGCVLYEMTTGQRAFPAESQASLIAAIMKEEPRTMTELRPVAPAGLERVVKRCLAKDPDARFQSASDLAFDLESLSASYQASGFAVPAGTTARPRRLGRVRALIGVAALVGLAFVAGHTLWRPAPLPQPAFERLTFRRGTIDGARFTPDGQTVVFDARWDGEPSEIYTVRPGNPESRTLGIRDARLLDVSSSGELAVQLRPAWHSRWYIGTLARLPLEGRLPRELRERVYEANWTPDGSELVIALADTTSDRFSIQLPAGTPVVRSMSSILPMRLSPDGHAIAYTRSSITDLGGELVLAATGVRDRPLVSIDNTCTGMAWHPHTREIWYSEVDTAGSTCLYAVSVAGRRRQLLRLAGRASIWDIRSDGAVLLTTTSARRAVNVLAPGAMGERDLSWFDGSGLAALSDDGRMLVLVETGAAGGRAGHMYLRPTDGSPAVRIGEGIVGRFSPDGKWVAVRIPADPHPRIRIIPVGAGEARDVAMGDVVPTAGVWFMPDGRRLLFLGRRGQAMSQLFTVPIEGGTPRAVTPPGWTHWAGQQTVSPDGRWIACTDGAAVNHVVPADSGAARRVPGLETGDVVIGWTDDSRGLYVHRRREVPTRVFRVDVATGSRQLWTTLGPADLSGVSLISGVTITPGGRAYAYQFDRAQTDLYLVKGLR